MADVVMPQLGETVAEGTVAKWFKKVGDVIERGDVLFEVSTDKVDTEIPAQAAGVLSEIRIAEGVTVDVGTVLAVILAPGEEALATVNVTPSPIATPVSSSVTVARVAHEAGEKLSPLIRRLLGEHGLAASQVNGTGPGGRITKEDVAAAAAAAAATVTTSGVGDSSTLSPVVRRLLGEKGLRVSDVAGSGPNGRLTRKDVENAPANGSKVTSAPTSLEGDEVITFTKIRRLTAEHMIRSKATSAHTLMVKEIDFEEVEKVRRRYGPAFKEREGFSLTYLPFIAVATMQALREFPHLSASVGDNELIVHHTLNLGIAVDVDAQGLVVPVLKQADRLSVVEMARSIRDVALRARSKSLSVDDMSAGTFTITNPGPYGTLMTGAVINQPQVAILATDGIARKPVVVQLHGGDEAIVIHSVGLVALTFDHRAIDGAYSAKFLARLAELLQRDWSDSVSA